MSTRSRWETRRSREWLVLDCQDAGINVEAFAKAFNVPMLGDFPLDSFDSPNLQFWDALRAHFHAIDKNTIFEAENEDEDEDQEMTTPDEQPGQQRTLDTPLHDAIVSERTNLNNPGHDPLNGAIMIENDKSSETYQLAERAGGPQIVLDFASLNVADALRGQFPTQLIGWSEAPPIREPDANLKALWAAALDELKGRLDTNDTVGHLVDKFLQVCAKNSEAADEEEDAANGMEKPSMKKRKISHEEFTTNVNGVPIFIHRN